MIKKGMTMEAAAEVWMDEGFIPIPLAVMQRLHAQDEDYIREITTPCVGESVRIFAGKYADANGIISGICKDLDFCMVRRNGTQRPVKVSIYDMEFDAYEGYFPMYGKMWAFKSPADNDWLDTPEGLQAMCQCGFRVYECEDFGYVFGIDGAGYSFFDKHFLPLYKARGLQWHDPEAGLSRITRMRKLREKLNLTPAHNKLVYQLLDLTRPGAVLTIRSEQWPELPKGFAESLIKAGFGAVCVSDNDSEVWVIVRTL